MNGYEIYTSTHDWIRIENDTTRMVLKFTQAQTTEYELNTKPHEWILNLHETHDWIRIENETIRMVI